MSQLVNKPFNICDTEACEQGLYDDHIHLEQYNEVSVKNIPASITF